MPAKGKGAKAKKARLEEEENLRKQKLPEVLQRFNYLYEIYDQEALGTISEEDFPFFVRSLGLYPTNAKLRELGDQCREKDGDAFYANNKLEAVLTPLVVEVLLNPNHELAPPSEEQLKLALKSLDLEHKGHLTEGDFRTLLSNNGEKLDPDELEPAVDEAVNPATGVVDLDRYAGRLLMNSKLSYVPRFNDQPETPKEEKPELKTTAT
ncbi:EF hand family protein [Tritrichomonas foetus]|uniref:EF hand family protein n=1 Tax=Tritrichomonas foetus TaxID=1144522 RepID=A0A1J4KBN5_9EUKA|nr:EF hand family protein [Tritrichomonas foetus]|eukprot:OHT08825.1 EF hand family protein [Tritrichomonas foetus]